MFLSLSIFFFNDTATTEIYTLSLHDALPISGSANFLSRTTGVLAAVFFILSLALAYTATRRPTEEGGGVIDVIRNKQQQVPAPAQKPAADAPKPSAQPQDAAPAQAPSDKQVPQ